MQIYRDSAAADSISLETAPHGDKDFSLLGMPGSYRCVAHFHDTRHMTLLLQPQLLAGIHATA